MARESRHGHRSDCLWWTGAVTGRGHGRFWLEPDHPGADLGPEHPDTLTSRSNLAAGYQALGGPRRPV